MERKEIILDTSIIVKWFTQEENHEKAASIRNKFLNKEVDIIVPDLLIYELANALRFNPNFNIKDVEDAISSIYDMDLTIIVPLINTMQKSIQLAFSKDITIYDSIYIALASDLNCNIITADKKLHNKVKELGFITLLEEFTN